MLLFQAEWRVGDRRDAPSLRQLDHQQTGQTLGAPARRQLPPVQGSLSKYVSNRTRGRTVTVVRHDTSDSVDSILNIMSQWMFSFPVPGRLRSLLCAILTVFREGANYPCKLSHSVPNHHLPPMAVATLSASLAPLCSLVGGVYLGYHGHLDIFLILDMTPTWLLDLTWRGYDLLWVNR